MNRDDIAHHDYRCISNKSETLPRQNSEWQGRETDEGSDRSNSDTISPGASLFQQQYGGGLSRAYDVMQHLAQHETIHQHGRNEIGTVPEEKNTGEDDQTTMPTPFHPAIGRPTSILLPETRIGSGAGNVNAERSASLGGVMGRHQRADVDFASTAGVSSLPGDATMPFSPAHTISASNLPSAKSSTQNISTVPGGTLHRQRDHFRNAPDMSSHEVIMEEHNTSQETSDPTQPSALWQHNHGAVGIGGSVSLGTGLNLQQLADEQSNCSARSDSFRVPAPVLPTSELPRREMLPHERLLAAMPPSNRRHSFGDLYTPGGSNIDIGWLLARNPFLPPLSAPRSQSGPSAQLQQIRQQLRDQQQQDQRLMATNEQQHRTTFAGFPPLSASDLLAFSSEARRSDRFSEKAPILAPPPSIPERIKSGSPNQNAPIGQESKIRHSPQPLTSPPLVKPLNSRNFFYAEMRDWLLRLDDSQLHELLGFQHRHGAAAAASSPSPHHDRGVASLPGLGTDDHPQVGRYSRIRAALFAKAGAPSQDERKAKLLSARQNKDQKRRKHRKVHGKLSFNQMNSLINAEWKILSDTEKMFYKEVAIADKERYERELASWKEDRLGQDDRGEEGQHHRNRE